jgi:pimeloyl-ACP methyl ester carboxylesterase
MWRVYRIPSSDGVTITLHDLGGTGPHLLFCHPTGFHGLVWAPVAGHLGDVAHCWALDFRGHGDSGLPINGSLDWHGMADDVLAVVDHLDTDEIYGAGHSMGGTALLMAEQRHPGTWAALWCYEPIVFPPFEGPRPRANPLADTARRRRANFPSRAAALDNYGSKPPLHTLHPDALAAYVEHGFRELPDGSVELKCDPDTEARVFNSGISHGAFARLGDVQCPVTVCASGDGAPPATVAGLVADALPHGRLEQFPQLTHFGPMEAPETIAQSLRKMLANGDEGPS